MTGPFPTGRLPALDGLRGLAALSVAWFHIVQKSGTLDGEAGPVSAVLAATSAYGWLGVPAFFVLTGFIIPTATFRGASAPHAVRLFLAKRAVRLYPPFAATVLLAVAVAHAAPLVPGFAGGAPANVTAQSVLRDLLLASPLAGEPWLVPVFWSLLVEVQYYLVVAAVLLAVPHWRGPDLTLPLCLFAAAMPLLTRWDLHAATSWAPLFVIGHALYRHCAGRATRRETAALLAFCLAVSAVTMGAVVLVPLALTIGVLLLRPPPGRALVLLGAISYSLYLTHYVVGTRAVRLIERFVGGEWGQAVACLGALAVAVAAAAVFHLAVERPALRLAARIRPGAERLSRGAGGPAIAMEGPR